MTWMLSYLLADCTRQPTEQELEFLLATERPLKPKVMLVLNKIDLLEKKMF